MAAPKQNEIQWMRALAAIEVVIWHSDLLTKGFSAHLLSKSPWYQPLGGIGVELFFIVSGYVICMRAPVYKNGLAFMASRIARLFPMYWIFTSLVVLAFLINPHWNLHHLNLGTSSIIESYLILPQQKDPILGLGWSLELEMIFYAFVAVLMTVGGSLWARYKIQFGFFLAGLSLLGFILGTGPSAHVWDLQLFSPYMLAFAFGWLARCMDEPGRSWSVWTIGALAAVALASAVVADPLDRHLVYRMILVVIVFAVFSTFRTMFNTDNRVNRLASRIGDASYSIYLSHWFVLSSAGKLFGTLGLSAALEGVVRTVGVILCVAIGIFLFDWLEKPIDRRLRGGRPPAPRPGVGVAPAVLRPAERQALPQSAGQQSTARL